MKAVWNSTLLAESDDTIEVDGNRYFPLNSVRRDRLVPSITDKSCHWKGAANYYHVVVDGKLNRDAAWYYPDPLERFAHIKGLIAFGKDIRVVP